MSQLRREEVWAGECLMRALPGIAVVQHDDGSAEGMHDLQLYRGDLLLGACEVTTATDGETVAFWRRTGSADERWIEPDLVGGWIIAALPSRSAKRLRRALPAILRELERRGHTRPVDTDTKTALDQLGVAHASQGGTSFPGSIYVSPELDHEKVGGFVAEDGNALPDWLFGWTRDETRADNLRKLGGSGCDERHLFVVLPPFTTAPFAVSDLFARSVAPLPTVDPDLPSAITHVWVAGAWSVGQGLRWGPAGWARFDTGG